jgi:hypothetical protein
MNEERLLDDFAEEFLNSCGRKLQNDNRNSDTKLS